jgi:hypothetical protein
MNEKGYGWDRFWLNLGYCFGIYVEGLRSLVEYLSITGLQAEI